MMELPEVIVEPEIPWFRNLEQPYPFQLHKVLSLNSSDAAPFRSIACFPWGVDGATELWPGSLHSNEPNRHLRFWRQMIANYYDAVAVSNEKAVYILFPFQNKSPICIKLRAATDKDPRPLPNDVVNLAWSLRREAPFEPLLIISQLSRLLVFNVHTKAFVSYLRGHGGVITSLVVHPKNPHLFCTTSRDFSARIYDLSLSPQTTPKNPRWPPGTQGSLAGAAHGLHMTESEGTGFGRCIIVLMGGRSGGHQAAVLGAAFHDHLPVVATCGVDRAVKIWLARPTSRDQLTREDKPLFSTTRLHTARVHSIRWLHNDTLISHSAPAVMYQDTERPNPRETYLEAGELVIWRWLGVDRFFPSSQGDTHQEIIRGCASDYQDSASFKVVTAVSFPIPETQYVVPQLHLYQHLACDPLLCVLYPDSTSISVLNIAKLEPRHPPPFPMDDPDIVASIKRPRVDPSGVVNTVQTQSNPLPSMWSVGLDGIEGQPLATIEACAITRSGTVVAGVGTNGTLWIWCLRK
ncbi:hypothetical protein BDN72DRAFT_783997 [Pluteus cervinus]|uniref:Uncharacterized protein n=1 Tax=Pluteus cervinus TaxID=181527 RepID=A0ACD3BGJ1_9AGAR|nr:hypothetical protein BDN72DRAFT_783997 [Pluteus cervinus]